MVQLHKAWASTFGIGYIKGGGTVAALFCCLCIYGCWHYGIFTSVGFIIATIVVTLSGIWSGNVVEKDWGEDSSRVVVDEVAGMCISLLFVKLSLASMLTGFVLFRFFDIAKPLGVRKMEMFPAGWGVMADDVLAGIYANLSLQFIIWVTNQYSTVFQ
jgi:phosphatidylglycerophosphatase A